MAQAPKTHPRPLSPHLQIYRPQITSVLSILHRLTGIALYAGLLVLVFWLLMVANDAPCALWLQQFWPSVLGRILLFGWSFCFFYHMANGVRHLAWDAGYGFDLSSVTRTGWTVVIFSLAFTLLAWCAAYAIRDGQNFF
jgi:succinate dehydrogenase / fumarate reductase, cytochrome b subunit